jgi:hypothetical protein
MIPVIATVTLVGAAVWIINELNEMSANEKQRWCRMRDDIEHTIEWHQNQIDQHLDQALQSYDFHQLVNMHYSCVKVANQAYGLLQDARKALKATSNAIFHTNRQRDSLLKQKNKTVHTNLLVELDMELNSLQSLRTTLFGEQDELRNQRDELLHRVKSLNNKIHQLKISISRNTGREGQEWFERLEARKLNRD